MCATSTHISIHIYTLLHKWHGKIPFQVALSTEFETRIHETAILRSIGLKESKTSRLKKNQLVWAQSSINRARWVVEKQTRKHLVAHNILPCWVTTSYSDVKRMPFTSKIQELQRVQIPRKAADDDHKKRSCRHGEHVSDELTLCQLRLSSSDKERVFHKWTAKWSHHFAEERTWICCRMHAQAGLVLFRVPGFRTPLCSRDRLSEW